jgi:hypothetical protein
MKCTCIITTRYDFAKHNQNDHKVSIMVFQVGLKGQLTSKAKWYSKEKPEELFSFKTKSFGEKMGGGGGDDPNYP